VRKEEIRARLAEMAARNKNDLELDRTAEACPCLEVKLTIADQRKGSPRGVLICSYGKLYPTFVINTHTMERG
jgi:hypothetical protein